MPSIGLTGSIVMAGILGIGALLWLRAKLKQAEEERQKRIERDIYIIGLMRAKQAEESGLDAASKAMNEPDTMHEDPLRW